MRTELWSSHISTHLTDLDLSSKILISNVFALPAFRILDLSDFLCKRVMLELLRAISSLPGSIHVHGEAFRPETPGTSLLSD